MAVNPKITAVLDPINHKQSMRNLPTIEKDYGRDSVQRRVESEVQLIEHMNRVKSLPTIVCTTPRVISTSIDTPKFVFETSQKSVAGDTDS